MAKPAATPISVFAEWSLIGRVGFGCFLLALVLAPLIGGFPPGAQYGSDVALNALRALVIVSSGCLLVSPPPLVSEHKDLERQVFTNISVGAVWVTFVWTLLSLLVHSRFLTSPVLLFAMLPAAIDWLVYALVFWTATRFMRNPRLLTYILTALVASAGIAALMLVREYGQFAQMGMKAQRAQAPFFSPNFAAGFFALTLPVVVAFFIAQKERLAVLGTGVVATLMLGALAATGSRAGLALAVLGTGFALLLVLVSRKNGFRAFPWVRVGALVLAFGVLAFGFRGPLTARVEGGAASSQEHSGDFRKETAKSAVGMARANPFFGTGPGTFPYRYAPYARAARTDLAHESYIQLAAEQGFLALLAALGALFITAIGGILALRRLRRDGDEADVLPRLLVCGLLGGVLAGAGRSLFDSEWSLLGNGIPFWFLAGLLVGGAIAPSAKERQKEALRPDSALRYCAMLLVVPLIFCVMLLQTASTRDTLTANRQNITPADVPPSWPPDPQLLYLAGKTEEAAHVEPSGRRWYQVGLSLSRQPGQEAQAAQAFQKSVEADPTNLQARRRLAEAREKAGDAQGALQAWQELATRYEGPIGQIRAIPELTELYPAFAYAALARAAKTDGKNTEALGLYQKAADVIERYSQTTPTYQQVEVQAAQSNGVDLAGRRREARDLYNEVMDAQAGLTTNAADKTKLMERKTDTLARFDALLKPAGNDAPNSTQ